ncbi:MAG TPA: hypothetical protein ENK89_01465 [Desulfobulbaceae bacterium]|nr:hypothetical protein [Desulfobulbaceae bacterium]
MEGIQTALLMEPYLDNGDAIELVIQDDQNIPELSIKALKKLVTVDKVAAVILLSTSGSALAVNSIADDYRVPVLVLLATHPEISTGTRYVNQLCFDNIFQGKVAALFVRDELLIERVAVFMNPDSSYSRSLADEFMREFRSIEGQVIDVVPVTAETANYEEIAGRLQKQGVQLLYLPVDVKNVIEISRALEKTGWSPKVMGSDSLLTNALARYPEELYLLEGYLEIDLYSSDVKATPYLAQVKKIFRGHYTTRNSTYPAAGFEGAILLMEAMNRCSDPAESACISSQIRTVENFAGIMGKISIQPDGKTRRPLIVNRISGKKLQLVVKVN